MATQYYSRSRPRSAMGMKAEALLARYPHLSDQELDALVEIFPFLPMADVARLTADERMSGQLAAFHRDHGPSFQSPLASLMWLIAVTALVVAGTFWWVLG